MHDEAAEIDENEFALAVRDEANRLTLQRQIQLGGGQMPKQREHTHDDELAAIARHAQREQDEWVAYCAKQRAESEQIEARRREREYHLPMLTGTAKIAPADADPWPLLNMDELSALDPNDLPPIEWRALGEDTRKHLVGLVIYICRICKPDAQRAAYRSDMLRSTFGTVVETLAAGKVPESLTPDVAAFAQHFVVGEPERVLWSKVRFDLIQHFPGAASGRLQRELLSRLDRPDGAIAAIKSGIARALAALTKRRTSHDPWRAA